MEGTCRAKRDFLRHIAMPSIAEALVLIDQGQALQPKGKGQQDVKQLKAKVAGLLSEIKRRLSSAEVSYNFSIYGGQPERLAPYLSGPEWDEIVKDVLIELEENQEALAFLLDVLRRILTSTAESYNGSCPSVEEAAKRALSRLDELAGQASAASQAQEGGGPETSQG